jgi:uncharacterized membrane protein YukC
MLVMETLRISKLVYYIYTGTGSVNINMDIATNLLPVDLTRVRSRYYG